MDINGLGSFYTDMVTDKANSDAATSKLRNSLSTTDYSNASDEELMDACKQFESYFLEQVFKEMQKTIPNSEDESSSTSSMVDYFKDKTIQDLSAQSTEQNSLGLAQMLFEQMKRNYDI